VTDSDDELEHYELVSCKVPDEPLTLVRTVQTSVACPSQWDAWDEEGRYYYLRYRSGCGQMRRYQTENWVNSDQDELIDVVAEFRYGHPLDGLLSLQDFARFAGVKLAENLMETGFEDYLRDELITGGAVDPKTAFGDETSQG
jgi:hypothetical protein